MMLDFPVLGYPIRPTEICLREACSELNCRNNVISDPLPKEFVMDAWNARVGYSFDSDRTHWA